MPTCVICGEEFDLTEARRSIGRRYGAGEYDDSFPDGDVCGDCAYDEFESAISEGKSIMDCMPYEWD